MRKPIPTPGPVLIFLPFLAAVGMAVFFHSFWLLVAVAIFMGLTLLAEAWNAYNMANEIEGNRWKKIIEMKERQEQLKKKHSGH